MDYLEYEPIKLHKNSVDYLERIFEQYTDGQLNRNTVVSNPIVHMYAKKDTYANDGELEGFVDSLFFRVEIYDPINLIRYHIENFHDSINFNNVSPYEVKIFKDGSTLLAFTQDCRFRLLTTLQVDRV